MRLVVDASILVAEAMRTRGRELLLHSELDLFVADLAWGETTYELRKRAALLVQHGHLAHDQAAQLLDDALAATGLRIQSVPLGVYQAWLAEATWRIPRDVRDAPTVALALAFDCGIWTADRDFFGCGLPVWSTSTLQHYLMDEGEGDSTTKRA